MLITWGDFIETWFKIRQRGLVYILSKFNPQALERVKGAFNATDAASSNYWLIPQVKQRWNKIISGNPAQEYADHVVSRYLKEKSSLQMLSLGCGAGSHEIKFAVHPCFASITGIDLAPKLIEAANAQAKAGGLSNLAYKAADIYEEKLPASGYDVILFHSSLHHFENVEAFLVNKIIPALKPGGLLVIHEYVGPNRIRWTSDQLRATNHLLQQLPAQRRTRFLLNSVKNRAHRPGTWRMILSDPSEAVDSSSIMPAIHAHFTTLEEHALGGNIIMPLFKDIAHHFTDGSPDTLLLLQKVFDAEDEFLKSHASDFVFGVFQKKS